MYENKETKAINMTFDETKVPVEHGDWAIVRAGSDGKLTTINLSELSGEEIAQHYDFARTTDNSIISLETEHNAQQFIIQNYENEDIRRDILIVQHVYDPLILNEYELEYLATQMSNEQQEL